MHTGSIKSCISLPTALLLFILAAAFTSSAWGRLLAFPVHKQREKRQLHASNSQNFTPASCHAVYSVNPKARESQSCSIGATKPYVGPLRTWSDVKAMLQARSFKGEIILTHETRADAVLQWTWRMLRMGYAHTVVVSRGEHSCWQLRKLYGDNLGCVWFAHSISYSAAKAAQASLTSSSSSSSSSSLSSPSSSLLQPPLLAPDHVALFIEEAPYWRIQLAAMVLRLGGYNLLVLDTDVLLQDDFYWWIRQPDYGDYQMLVQRDEVKGGPDLGVLYVRGASPSGPAAWALAEGLLRNIRWLEQPRLPATFNSTFSTCWEQAVVTDSIYSALVGRPIFWRCLEMRPLDLSWSTREDGRSRFLDANEQLIRAALSRKTFTMARPGPACHAPLVGSGLEELWGWEGQLRLPHFHGEWPEALGGRALGSGVGPVARAFLQMLGEAGTPMWPDPEDPDTEAAAAAVPSERFTQLSRHLACDWIACGSRGMFMFPDPVAVLDPDPGREGDLAAAGGLRPEPCVVLGHLGNTPDKALGKRLQLMVNGHYNMDLAAAVHGPGGPYFATNTQLQGGPHHHGALAHHHSRRGHIPGPRVVALAPGALSPEPYPAAAAAAAAVSNSGDATAAAAAVTTPFGSGSGAPLVLASKAHMIGVITALSSVAVAAGRTLALPRLSCSYSWMHRGGRGPSTSTSTVVELSQPFNGSHHIPWSYLASEAFAPYGPSLDALSCEWLAWVQHGCLHGPVHMERQGHAHANPHPAARMLLSYEMEYLIRQLPPEERIPRRAAENATTTTTDDDDGRGGGNMLTVPPGALAGPDGLFNVTMAQISGQLSRIAPENTVVWLERPMRVVDLPVPVQSAHHQWVNHCCGLSWPHSRNHICFGDF